MARKKQATRSRTARRRGITPEDLHRICFVGSPRMSPDGDRIAFVRKHIGPKNNYITNLWMVSTAGDEPPQQFTSGERDSAPIWSPHGDALVFVSAREKTRPQIYRINADGGEATALTSFPEGSIGAVKWAPDGRHLAVSFREQEPDWTEAAKKHRQEHGLTDPPRVLDHWWYRLDGDGYFNAQRHHVYLVDVETGEHELAYTKDTLGSFSFDFSPDGRRLAITTNRDRRAALKAWNDDILILDVGTKKLRQVPNLPDGPKDAVAWSPDGKHLAIAAREGTDPTYSVENLELWVCDPQRGTVRRLTAKTDYCMMAVALTDAAEAVFGPNIRWSPDSRRIYMKLGWHGESHVASVPTRGGPVTFHTSGAYDYDLGSISDDGRRIAAIRADATTLGEIHVLDLARGATEAKATALTSFNREFLREVAIAKPRSHWIKASDGHKVQVWVMKPPLSSKKKHPAVLEIHGGPHAMYGVGFFHEFQVLAAAGYTVFYSNPRGSKGYGRDHCAAIRGAWGTADWTDVQAVTEFMQSRPDVDAKRMGVMGGSYGGYMTNWVIGHTHDYKAAITDRCVSNLLSMAGSSDFIDLVNDYFPGNVWDKIEQRREMSPLKYFDKVKTPTLVIHSEGDLRCNVEQGEQVYTSLTLRRVPTRFVRYPKSTSHGMSRSGPPDMRVHRLHQILDWWERYL